MSGYITQYPYKKVPFCAPLKLSLTSLQKRKDKRVAGFTIAVTDHIAIWTHNSICLAYPLLYTLSHLHRAYTSALKNINIKVLKAYIDVLHLSLFSPKIPQTLEKRQNKLVSK